MALGGTGTSCQQWFQTQWISIDREKWEGGFSHEETARILVSQLNELAEFLTRFLSVHQPRDDYKELLDLSLLSL